jgi:hypothetical protein
MMFLSDLMIRTYSLIPSVKANRISTVIIIPLIVQVLCSGTSVDGQGTC